MKSYSIPKAAESRRHLFVSTFCFIFWWHLFYIISHDVFSEECNPILTRFYGVMVSTQDFESCDPSSNLGRTLTFQHSLCLTFITTSGDDFCKQIFIKNFFSNKVTIFTRTRLYRTLQVSVISNTIIVVVIVII